MASGFTPIPLGLDDFVQGGLASDVPVEIIEIQFRGFDYGGNVQKDVLAVWMKLALLDDNLKRTTDEPLENFWSAGGDLDEVAVSDDGYQVGVLQNGSKTAMTKGSNFEVLCQSLTKPTLGGPAMPRNWIRDNQSSLKCLLGTKFHMVRTPAPKREGIDTSGRKRKDYDPTIATCTKVYWAPWAPKTATGKAVKGAQAQAPAAGATAGTPAGQVNGAAVADAGTTAGTPDTGATDDITNMAKDTVNKALADNPIFEKIDDLKIACFRLHAKTKAEQRNAIVKLISDPAWLKTAGFKIQDPDASGNQVIMA